MAEYMYNIYEEAVLIKEYKYKVKCTFEDGTVKIFANYDKAIATLEKMGYRF